jgi:hypothetical protein
MGSQRKGVSVQQTAVCIAHDATTVITAISQGKMCFVLRINVFALAARKRPVLIARKTIRTHVKHATRDTTC